MRRLLALMALAVLGALALHLTGSSGASYVVRTTNTATVSAASDWTPPTVSVTAPNGPLTGTVTIAATAADDRSGVASVTLQYLAPGASTWTTLCVATTAPYGCSWSTAGVADGSYSLRATAVDNAGYSATSAVVPATVANNLAISLADPGDAVRGTAVPLTATLAGTGGNKYQVLIQYADAGTSSWTTLCGPSAATSTSYSCTWDTTAKAFPQGNDYDLRALATTAGTAATAVATSATINSVTVDNVAPAATMTDPGSPLRGTVTLSATATDADSGVAEVQLQYQATGASTWTTACTLSTDPYSCRFDTTALAKGTYSFRAVATDAARNTTTSAAVTNRAVDNTLASVSVEDPGAYVSGSVTVAATVSVPTGVTVTSVRIERAPAGGSAWTALCTDTTAPYSCVWDTTTAAGGSYNLRAVLTDSTGATTTSATVTTLVDNTPLRGYDLQATNGSGIAGRVDAGDTLAYTFTTQVDPASLLPGWTGAATAVTVRLKDNTGVLGLNGSADSIDVYGPGGTSTTVNLGSVNLKGNYIGKRQTALYNATMTASTTTVNGVPATAVTVTLGSMTSGTGLKTVTSGTMVWTPSTAAKDLAGRAASATAVTERGTMDKDF